MVPGRGRKEEAVWLTKQRGEQGGTGQGVVKIQEEGGQLLRGITVQARTYLRGKKCPEGIKAQPAKP